ncbi:Hypothetical protein PBC10988_13980 [Planctomycetales bacterium 10988]|nr:Hypothetical protein PBC10988_13980 [Planctomycetales bacterium 10988]
MTIRSRLTQPFQLGRRLLTLILLSFVLMTASPVSNTVYAQDEYDDEYGETVEPEERDYVIPYVISVMLVVGCMFVITKTAKRRTKYEQSKLT